MLANSTSKIIVHHSTPLHLLKSLEDKFHFGLIIPMPDEIEKLTILEDQRLHPNFIGPVDQTANEAFITNTCHNYKISSSRDWREKNWGSRFDCFDATVINNKIQFKTNGSAPYQLLEKWIKTYKISCDIANLQDDFEYWSFASYKDGELVKFEDTLDEILLKVLMMIDEKKPTVSLFKQIYRDIFDTAIPKDRLNTYRNGEIYAHL